MVPEARHYCWDRLVRAVLRKDVMSDSQRESLQDFILSRADEKEDKDLIDAAKKMVAGKLSEESVVNSYNENKLEDFDVNSYRMDMAPKDTSSEVDKKLEEIFG